MCKKLWIIISFIFLYLEKTLQISNNIPTITSALDDNFKVYWNSPTFQCKTHKIYFDNLLDKYKILHNGNVTFRGEIINILYDPGMFPALLTNGTEYYYRNGGLPQNGNISLHYKHFKESIMELIPDPNFNGVGVIDFESWRPVFRQNFGTLTPYKTISIEEEKLKHPTWPNTLITKEATRRFEYAGRKFMEQTLKWAKELRPNAAWGYYAYPYCYNMSPNNMQTDCSEDVKKENDKIAWLFDVTQNFYPSLYVSENGLNLTQKIQLIEGRINESHRISKNTKHIYPYFWYKYRDTDNFLSQEDLKYMLFVLKALKINGIILWGSSNDVNSKIKCNNLYDYLDNILGPILVNTHLN